MTAHHNDWDTFTQRSESSSSITSSSDSKIVALKAKMTEINKNLMKVLQVNQQVKAVTPSCETCGGSHSYNDFPATVGQTQNVYAAGAYNQGDLKGIATRSGIAYKGPTIPTTFSPLKVVERKTKVSKDTVPPTNNGSTKDIQPPVVEVETQVPNSEPVVAPVVKPVEAPVSALKPNPKPSILYLFADALILMTKFASTIKSLLTNKEKLFELARTPLNEHCSMVLLKKLPEKLRDPGKFLISCDFSRMDDCLALADLGASINLMPLSVWNKLFLPELSPTCMTLELADRLISSCEEYSQEVLGFSVSGNPTPSTKPIVSTSSLTLTPFVDKLKVVEPKNEKYSIDEPPVVELKDLPPHLEYAFLEGDDKLPIIIAKDLKDEEKIALIKVLKSHKQALAWQLSDIKSISKFDQTHKILMGDNFKLAVQHQRRVNPKIHEVIKKEVLKLLDAGLIYHISDNPWVSPVHCVPKKGGFTVVENEENELVPTRLVTGWHVCIDYRKLNDATRKDHFPLPFMDQMLKRLAENEYYCFLDRFSGYFQIPIDPQDQEKTTFTCPYGTFAYRRMPFGLCNAPGTFQRCMMAIFHDMIEKMMEVFMDDFSVFGNSFGTCLSHLDKMLKRCEDTNLCLT
uniref:Reverse transcriptase domain-containing protein n=1 Tax=Tanacetum cinerariifolium TaxID=118510 RepID=A0A699IHQ9_TANCI|nr:reverse transcriptase domain-containing protein [Tanacetum cinerariifolium]